MLRTKSFFRQAQPERLMTLHHAALSSEELLLFHHSIDHQTGTLGTAFTLRAFNICRCF
jgi:hypothetical protein